MASQINLGQTTIPVGTSQYVIDGLPTDSSGFELIVGRHASWDTLTGRIFQLEIAIAVDGVNYQPWIFARVNGGPAPLDRNGDPMTYSSVSGSWPGENDGSGGRRVLRALLLRATLTVDQAFTASSIVIRTVT